MRILITNLLAVAALLFGATAASAFSFNMSVRGGLLPSYSIGDTVTVDVFMDADPGLVILGLPVIAPSAALDYDGVASTNLPVIYPNGEYGTEITTGSHPGYILYYSSGKVSQTVYPLVNDGEPFFVFAGALPGEEHVNVQYAEGSFNPTGGSGTNIWIASLVYHVIGGAGSVADVGFNLDRGGAVLNQNGIDLVETAPETIGLSAPIGVNIVPEPAAASLGIAVVTLTAWLVRRRRA